MTVHTHLGSQAWQIPVMDDDGWIVIQQRVNASVSFDRSWEGYVTGFGDANGNFWLGLCAMNMLTTAYSMHLQIYVDPFNLPGVTINYSGFLVGDAASDYTLSVTSVHSGDEAIHNSLNFHSGMRFSTPDRDNDIHVSHCAAVYSSGWWFNGCFRMNLNGVYQGESVGELGMRMLYLSSNANEPIRTVVMKLGLT